MPRLVLLAMIFGLLGLGCSPKTEEMAAESKPETAVQTPTEGEKLTEKEGEKSLDVSQVPENLRHQAFRYLGLAQTDAVNYRLTMTGAQEPSSGAQKAQLIRLSENEAVFRVERTGDIAARLGTDEFAVRPDGVYGVKTSVGTMDGERLELPANLTPGDKWKSTTALTTSDGQKISLSIDNVVLPARKVQTPAGTFEAIVVQGTGTGDFNGQKRTIKTQSFYVLDKGMAKMSLTTEGGDQPTSSVTIERVP